VFALPNWAPAFIAKLKDRKDAPREHLAAFKMFLILAWEKPASISPATFGPTRTATDRSSSV
jgi:hypothetical protein